MELTDVEVAGGDCFILCSDGLSGVVEESEIATLVQAHSPEAAAEALVDLANERGGPDNVTVQILAVPIDENQDDPEVTAPVELTAIGIEAIESKRRQRERGRRAGLLFLVAVVVSGGWLLWQTLRPSGTPPQASPHPRAPSFGPAGAQPPEEAPDRALPTQRRGIPRDASPL